MQHNITHYDIALERSILSSILVGGQYELERIMGILSKEDFYLESNRILFDLFFRMKEKHVLIDTKSVLSQLDADGQLVALGGAEAILKLCSEHISAANIESEARLISKKSQIRQLVNMSGNIIEDSKTQGPVNYDDFLDGAEQKMFKLLSEKKGRSNFVDLSAVSQKIINDLDIRFNCPDDRLLKNGLDTGFKDIDEMLDGIKPTDLIIVAARPSMGKTAFGLNIVLNVVAQTKFEYDTMMSLKGIEAKTEYLKAIADGTVPKSDKRPIVALFSLEMSAEQLMYRLISSASNVPIKNIRTGKLDSSQHSSVINAMGDISSTYNLYIDDSSMIDPFEIRSKCRKLKANAGLDLIVIDYLQLMMLKNQKSESRERQVSEMSRLMKAMAKELEVPIILLSQLNRQVEARADKKPFLSDLRESGSIEQDADVIMLLYRESYYNQNAMSPNKATVIIAKNRNGGVGDVDMSFNPELTKFTDWQEPVPRSVLQKSYSFEDLRNFAKEIPVNQVLKDFSDSQKKD